MSLPAAEPRRQLALSKPDRRLNGQSSPRNRSSGRFPSAWFPAEGTARPGSRPVWGPLPPKRETRGRARGADHGCRLPAVNTRVTSGREPGRQRTDERSLSVQGRRRAPLVGWASAGQVLSDPRERPTRRARRSSPRRPPARRSSARRRPFRRRSPTHVVAERPAAASRGPWRMRWRPAPLAAVRRRLRSYRRPCPTRAGRATTPPVNRDSAAADGEGRAPGDGPPARGVATVAGRERCDDECGRAVGVA